MNWVASAGLVGSWYLSCATSSLRKVSLSKSLDVVVVGAVVPVDPVPAAAPVEPVEPVPVTLMLVMALLSRVVVRRGRRGGRGRPPGARGAPAGGQERARSP